MTMVIVVSTFIFAFWPSYTKYNFPDNKKFAFAILDDTDNATLKNIEPIYQYLKNKKIISTKTVWMLPSNKNEHGHTHGSSLANKNYSAFISKLKYQGFEITSHGARGASSKRSVIIKGLKTYKKSIGNYPYMHINHSMNKDNLYWGEHRLTFSPLQWAYRATKGKTLFFGHIKNSPYFWGDIAKRSIKYSRDFSFHEINLAKIGSIVPRYVNGKSNYLKWFYTSNGRDINTFNKLLSPKNLDLIEMDGGYTIIYTHFGKGFFNRGQINPLFKQRIEDLTKRSVWITTTGELLEFLEKQTHKTRNNCLEEFRLQLRWSLEQLLYN